tara:strand:- start:4528 stop:4845 length:318 start_codon:yes stop_codon:yes gene_type:complete
MSAYSYGWEKLHLAVHSIAGDGDKRERLINAIVYNLIQITPEHDLPNELQPEFSEFMSEMIAVEASGDEGNIAATAHSFDGAKIDQAFGKIISFYDTVCRHMEPH